MKFLLCVWTEQPLINNYLHWQIKIPKRFFFLTKSVLVLKSLVLPLIHVHTSQVYKVYSPKFFLSCPSLVDNLGNQTSYRFANRHLTRQIRNILLPLNCFTINQTNQCHQLRPYKLHANLIEIHTCILQLGKSFALTINIIYRYLPLTKPKFNKMFIK